MARKGVFLTMEINFKLTVQETNLVLSALADRPFKEVNVLLGKLHAAATKQVAEIEKAGADGDSNKS
jgi:hypothetical protein